jgi:dienelactone hydrolase
MRGGRHLTAVGLVAALVVAACGGRSEGGGGPVTLRVHAASRLADAPVAIDIRGLGAHGRATLHARWISVSGHPWTSSVPLRADGSGAVALRGIDGMRFLWGMKPTGAAFRNPFFLPPPKGPSRVALSLTAGGRTVARATLSRRVAPASVRVKFLYKRRNGVQGVLFTPRVHTRRPAVVVFGGSEGHDSMFDVAGLLAAHGYPALSLAYFGERGLPPELVNIPLEYFARAVRMMRRMPQVDPDRVVVMGDSRGGEAALLIAASFPTLIHGAIGLVPSDSVYPAPAANLRAWTLHGRPVPLEQIPVERIRGPVLTAGAGDDHVWSSADSVRQIEKRLRARRFRYPHEGVVYPRAGHLIGTALPYEPAATDESASGGSPRIDAVAKADLWPRILRLLAGPFAR